MWSNWGSPVQYFQSRAFCLHTSGSGCGSVDHLSWQQWSSWTTSAVKSSKVLVVHTFTEISLWKHNISNDLFSVSSVCVVFTFSLKTRRRVGSELRASVMEQISLRHNPWIRMVKCKKGSWGENVCWDCWTVTEQVSADLTWNQLLQHRSACGSVTCAACSRMPAVVVSHDVIRLGFYIFTTQTCWRPSGCLSPCLSLNLAPTNPLFSLLLVTFYNPAFNTITNQQHICGNVLNLCCFWSEFAVGSEVYRTRFITRLP